MVKFVEALPKVNYPSIFIWKRSFHFHPISNVRSFTFINTLFRNIVVVLFTLRRTVRMQDGLRLNRLCCKQERTFMSVYLHACQAFCWHDYAIQDCDFLLTFLVNIMLV